MGLNLVGLHVDLSVRVLCAKNYSHHISPLMAEFTNGLAYKYK